MTASTGCSLRCRVKAPALGRIQRIGRAGSTGAVRARHGLGGRAVDIRRAAPCNCRIRQAIRRSVRRSCRPQNQYTMHTSPSGKGRAFCLSKTPRRQRHLKQPKCGPIAGRENGRVRVRVLGSSNYALSRDHFLAQRQLAGPSGPAAAEVCRIPQALERVVAQISRAAADRGVLGDRGAARAAGRRRSAARRSCCRAGIARRPSPTASPTASPRS